MTLVLSLLVGMAWSAEHHVVRADDTVETVAEALGDGKLADAIRELNNLEVGSQPEVGTVLQLPAVAGHVDHDAAILSYRGAVEAQLPGQAAKPASVGLALPLGTSVCSGADGFATIRLAVSAGGGTHDDLSMFPGTCLTIDGTSSREGSRSSLVSMESGSVSVRAADAEPGAITVVTPSGVTAGDGGGFRVTIEDAAARTEALDAAAVVIGAGEEVALDAGYGSRVKTGEAPSDPVKLLDPGSPAAPGDGVPLRRPDFKWAPVDRALAYRVELSVAPDFSDIVRVEDVGSTEWSPDRLFLPYRVPGLWWRVASVDRTGFVGKPSKSRALAIPEGLGP